MRPRWPAWIDALNQASCRLLWLGGRWSRCGRALSAAGRWRWSWVEWRDSEWAPVARQRPGRPCISVHAIGIRCFSGRFSAGKHRLRNGKTAGRSRVSKSSHWGIAGGFRREESAESSLQEDASLCCHSSLNCKTTPLLSLPKNCSGAVWWFLWVICGGGKGVKCCSETQVL